MALLPDIWSILKPLFKDVYRRKMWKTVAEIFLGHFQKPLNNGNGYCCDKIIPSFLRLMTFFWKMK